MALGDGCPASRAFLCSSQYYGPSARAHATGGTGAARRSRAASLQVSVFDSSSPLGGPQSSFVFASKWRGCIQWPRPESVRGRSAIAVSIATFALANEQNSIVHVLREAFGAQADRQNFGLEKWTAAVP